MSFAVEMYTVTDPYNKINKIIPSAVISAAGELKEDCSLMDPVILIASDTIPAGVNYAYISEFGRYYFIKNIEAYRTGLWSIEMHCDVLKTYSEAILSSPAVVSRSSSNFNMLLNDDHYYCQENPHIFTKAFPSGFDTSADSYILALIGQAVTSE